MPWSFASSVCLGPSSSSSYLLGEGCMSEVSTSAATALASAESSAPPAPPLNPQRILAALNGQIEPLPVGFFYRIGLFLVAVVMVILPVIYLAMIAGAGYLVYWHATENDFILA